MEVKETFRKCNIKLREATSKKKSCLMKTTKWYLKDLESVEQCVRKSNKNLGLVNIVHNNIEYQVDISKYKIANISNELSSLLEPSLNS